MPDEAERIAKELEEARKRALITIPGTGCTYTKIQFYQ